MAHSEISVRPAEMADISECKRMADANREALGFLTGVVFSDAAQRGRLLVAHMNERVVGFVRYNHRVRGTETALYDICVNDDARYHGVGRTLIKALTEECRRSNRASIVLRCPASLPANGFYQRLGFLHCGTEPGRRRALSVWRLSTEASACNS